MLEALPLEIYKTHTQWTSYVAKRNTYFSMDFFILVLHANILDFLVF